MKVVFPEKINNETYYRIHVRYLINLFYAMGCSVSFSSNTSIDGSKFLAVIDGVQVLFDFCDFSCETANWTGGPYFKFHYDRTAKYADNVRPFPPVSFYDWKEYAWLKKAVSYRADGFVSYRQRAYGGAVDRRTSLKFILSKTCKDILRSDMVSQEQYWLSINSDLTQVFAPGARTGILDRAQLQCMAFGECTISPEITDMLATNSPIAPIEYIQCRQDFADLPEIIEKMRSGSLKDMMIEVGKNAQTMFESMCAPASVYKYVHGVLHA